MDNPNPNVPKLDEVLVLTSVTQSIWIRRNLEYVIRNPNHHPKFFFMRTFVEVINHLNKQKPQKRIGIINDPNIRLDIDNLTEIAEGGNLTIVLLNHLISI